MYLGKIHATYSNSLSITCKGNSIGAGSCYFTSFYVPSSSLSAFNLQCLGTGCYYLNLYTQRLSFIDNNMDITLNPCSQ